MWDERIIAEVAARIAARILVIIQNAISAGAVGKSGARINPKVLTVKQAAQYIGRTERAVQHLIFNHELPVIRAGRRVHLLREDLDTWILHNRCS